MDAPRDDNTVEIARDRLVEMFFERGELDLAERVEGALPERFDPLAHADVLAELGLDPQLLMTQISNLEA